MGVNTWATDILAGARLTAMVPHIRIRSRGSRQVVRRQPSKLIFAGSNPVSRSEEEISQQLSAIAGNGAELMAVR